MFRKLIITILIASFALSVSAQGETKVENTTAKAATEEQSFVGKVTSWYMNNMNYGTVTLLMAVESSFIPFPSEVVVPPAAYKATKPDSDMNVILVVVFATLGALIGATINYYLALWLGRPIVYKFAESKLGHLFLLDSKKIETAEKYFDKHG